MIDPPYARWQDAAGYTQEQVRKAHATYCGEITMVDTWLGYLLARVENMGLMDKTAVIFTSDHGFYFGEHGGLFGKMMLNRLPDGSQPSESQGAGWGHSPLYEEIVRIPLLVYAPGVSAGVYEHLTSVVDVMPTVLEFLGQVVPQSVQGESLLPRMRDTSLPGREFVVSTVPFANPGDAVRSVDDFRRRLRAAHVTTVTSDERSLLYSTDPGMSALYNLKDDPGQERNIISASLDDGRELHRRLLQFIRETDVAPHLVESRLELKV